MPNIVKIPLINCIKYTQVDYEQLPQYFSKHMDDYPYIEAIRNYQDTVNYWQVWGNVDSIRQQLYTNIGPVNMTIWDCLGNMLLTSAFEQKQEDANNPTLFRYDSDLDLTPFNAGVFFIQLDFGASALTLISEPQILSADLSDTLLWEYWSSRGFYENMIFADGFRPSIRLASQMIFKEPGSQRVIYQDDPLNSEVIDTKNFRLWSALIGGVTGIPDYMIDKMNRIIGCDNLKADGRFWTVDSGGKLESESIEGYPMRGWRIDMRERYNLASKYFTTDINPTQRIALVANVESKGFIRDDAGGSFFQILNVD